MHPYIAKIWGATKPSAVPEGGVGEGNALGGGGGGGHAGGLLGPMSKGAFFFLELVIACRA